MTPDPSPRELASGVWRVPTPMPFRPRQVHAYLVEVEEGRWMLVDGGVNTDEAWAALGRAVARIAGGWRRLVLHAVTHMHLDHVGLAARTREASGAPLAMGELDSERAAHAAADPADEARYREALLRSSAVPDELARAIQGGRAGADPLGSFVAADHRLALAAVPLPQAEGWLSVWTPGHTAGHVALLRSSDGVLLAGDALLPRITPTIGVNRQRADPVGDYLETLARLDELAPSRALCGHGEPLEQPAERIRELRTATADETERVAALLGPERATPWEVARARYADRELAPSTLMLALRETLAHLDHLAALGRAERALEGGAVRFRLR